MGDQRVRIEVPPPVSQSRRLAVSGKRPRRSYASRPAPIALSRGRETVRGLRAEPQIKSAANEVNRRVLLLKIPHCGVRRQQD